MEAEAEQSTETAAVTERHFRLIPDDHFPEGRFAFPLVADDGSIVWCLRESYASSELVDDLNLYTEHIVRHGLLVPQAAGTPVPARPVHHAS